MSLEEFLGRLRVFGVEIVGSLKIDGIETHYLGRPAEMIVPFVCKTHPICLDKDIHPEVVLSVLRRFDITDENWESKTQAN